MEEGGGPGAIASELQWSRDVPQHLLPLRGFLRFKAAESAIGGIQRGGRGRVKARGAAWAWGRTVTVAAAAVGMAVAALAPR